MPDRGKGWFPEWAATRRPDRFTLLLASAAALGAGLVFLRLASYGPSMSWGAVNYIVVARNLLAGDGLVDLHGPFVSWPPLYPAMLAGGGLFGFDPYAVAGPLNAIVFGLTVLVAGSWLRRHLHSRFLWLWGCVSIALALPLAEVASHALSESAFILFVTLALTQIDTHLRGGGRAALVRAAAFSALACLTRYMGASLILAVVPLLLAARVAPREKMKHIAVYTLVAAAPVGLWMLRNVLISGTMTGERGRGFYSFSFIVDEALRLAGGDWWLVGLTVPVLLALVMAACHAFSYRSDRKRDAAVASDVAWGPLRVFGGFSLAYLTLLAAAMMSGGTWDGLQWRYLAPVYVPLLFAALLLMDAALRYAWKRVPRGPVPRRRGGLAGLATRRGALAAVLVLALSLQAVELVVLQAREIPRWNAGARQAYAAPRWRNSESVQYIREAALTGAIWSNARPVLALYADSPARHYGLPCEMEHLRSAWTNAPDGEVHILYFSDKPYLSCSRQQDDDLRNALSREPRLELVAELADGKLYRLRASVYYADRLGNRVKAITDPSEPVQAPASEAVRIIRSRYDVYLRGNRLIYENRSCSWEGDDRTRFLLAVYSLDSESGTPGRDRLDFAWSESSWQDNGACIIERQLPDKDIVGIRTGQVDRDGNPLWEAEHWFEEKGRRLAAASEPAARGVFDIYLGEGSLTFVKEPCARADTEATVFLHLIPADVDDLPEERKQYGFDNLDFAFTGYDFIAGGFCVETRELPDYSIATIRTGQYLVNQDGSTTHLWEEEIRFDE